MKDRYKYRRNKNRFMNLIWSIIGILVAFWVISQFMGGCSPWWNTFIDSITHEY